MKEKLRIGILLDDNEIPAWSYKMLSKVKNSLSSEIVLIVKNKTRKTDGGSFFKKFYKNRKNLVYLLYRKLDRKFFKVSPNAFEPKNIGTLLNGDTIEVDPINDNLFDHIGKKDIDIIKSYNIDIFIKLGFQTLDGDILKVPKYGIWAYHFNDFKRNKGNLPGFWEVIEKWSETGVVLQIFSKKFKSKTIFKSTSLTDNLSVERSLNNYHWKALWFLPRKIDELHRLGDKEFFKRISTINNHPEFYSNQAYETPANSLMLWKLIKFKTKRIINGISGLFYNSPWILLFKLEKSATISTSFYQFQKILPPKDRFWADPHVIKKYEKYYIFIEELIYKENKGFISVIEMDEDGNYKDPVKVLERDYHLSFPFIFQDKGEIYMIPESKQNNNIQLYKCVDFPYRWKLNSVLFDKIRAVDTVVQYMNGKYWLFTNVVKNRGASAHDELFLYWSTDLTSNNWKSHPENPIVSDVKNARSAGALFKYNGNLYRPSQNCSKRYGFGMQINQVLELNETSYKEKMVDSIYPNWNKNIKATHSISYVENLTVIDAVMKRRKYF